MEPIDKAAMGRRIKRIRTEAGLRQWQLAERLGTTQSAVHKYEHGVVPEPKRLVELAKVGRTTVEWILTGRHWEDGDEGRERMPREVYRIARAAAALSSESLDSLDDALTLLERAAAETALPEEGRAPSGVEGGPRTQAGLAASARALRAALRLHHRVVEAALEIEARRYERVSAGAGEGEGARSEG
jgi:transcriptional regulator with XRE-family HTH domain